MLLSYTKSFIHIHIYRVAGTSIRTALNKYQYPPYERYGYHWLKRLRVLPSDRSLPSHSTANQIRDALPFNWFDRFLTFAFVRNPWSWQVSLYRYALENPGHFQHSLIKSFQSFDEYIQWRVTKDKHLQKDFVTNESGALIVDFIGKFERVQRDFRNLCQQIGVNESLPHKNKSAHKPYYEYYTPKTKDLVYQHFQEDIDLFGYSFK